MFGLDPAGVAVFFTVALGVIALSLNRPDQWGHRRIALGTAVCAGTIAALLLSAPTILIGALVWGLHHIYVGWSYLSRRRRNSHEHIEYLTASVSVLAYIALADGDISERELQLIRSTYARAGFSAADLDEAAGIVRECQRKFQRDGSDFNRVFEWLRQACVTMVRHSNAHTRFAFFRAAILLAMTDGFISSGEDRALRAAGGWLGLSGEDVDRAWRSTVEANADERPEDDGSHVPPDLATYYSQVLGVPLSAGPTEVKRAYREKARQYHPDVVSHLGPEHAQAAEEKFKELSKAYEFLRGRATA